MRSASSRKLRRRCRSPGYESRTRPRGVTITVRRAERRVVDAVRDVEHARRRSARRARAARKASSVERRGRRRGQPALEIVGHRVTSWRSRFSPALTFCRAASSLMPMRSPDLGVGEVEREAVHDGGPLLRRERADAAPQPVVGGSRRSAGATGSMPSSSACGRRARRRASVGRLALRDGVQPCAQVVGGAKSWIGAKRGHEGLLEAVLGVRRADPRHEEPMELGGVGVDQRLERRELHAHGTRPAGRT